MFPNIDPIEFDRTLRKVIDESLTVIGEPSKKILYFHVEDKFLLKPEDISKQPELFVLALRQLMGKAGSYIVSLILKKLCEEYNVDYENIKDLSFEYAVKEIREKGVD